MINNLIETINRKLKIKKRIVQLMLFLVFIELGLRLIAFIVILLPLHQQNRYVNNDYELRVLTIGESTTAHTGNFTAWPEMLEKTLNEQGIKTKVFNVARPATTTSFLLQRLPNQLEKFKPHIVISMMGINDDNSFWLKEMDVFNTSSFFKNFRVVKLVSLLISEPKKRKKLFTDSANIKWNRPSDLGIKHTKRIMVNIAKDGIETHQKELDILLNNFSDIEKAQYYGFIGAELLPAWSPVSSLGMDFSTVLKLFKKSFRYSLKNNGSIELYILLLLTSSNQHECLPFAMRLEQEHIHFSDVILTRLATCSSHDNQKNKNKWEMFFRKKGLDRIKTTNQTSLNYNKLTKLLHQKNILHIAMEYPTVNIKRLKKIFGKDNQPDYFVSNQHNFNKVILDSGKSSVFTDFFAGEFGHTNNKGHALISDQLITPIIDLYAKMLK